MTSVKHSDNLGDLERRLIYMPEGILLSVSPSVYIFRSPVFEEIVLIELVLLYLHRINT
jgi:hypothetical protein